MADCIQFRYQKCWSAQDALLSTPLFVFLLWNSPGGLINILAICSLIHHPCCRQGLTRDPVCVPSTLGKMQMQQLNLQYGLHTADEGWFVCMCVAARPGVYSPPKRKCSDCTPWKTIHGESRGAWLFNFFPHECSLSTLCLCRPELFILHEGGEKNAKGYKDNQNGESLAWDTQTRPHTFTSKASPPTHAHAGMFT